MASGSLVGQSDAREQQDKVYIRKNQSMSKNPKSVSHQYNRQQYSQKTATDDSIPAASDDSYSQPGTYNRREPSHGNAIPGYAKFDSFVKISFDLSNREEVRALKRKLECELNKVTSLVKRLETSQIQLSKAINRNTVTVSVNKNGNNHGVLGESVEKEKMAPQMNRFYKNLDIVGGEKFGTLEGNKKLKSNMKGNGFVLNKDLNRLFNSCHNLLEKLMKHKYGWVFNKPVDVKGLGLLDYSTIIKHPMDLGTVKARLSKNLYKSPTEFAEDVRLTFCNAMLYNPKGQDVHIMAEELSKIFEETWTKMEAEYNFSSQPRMGCESPSPKNIPARLSPVRTSTPASSAPVCTPTSASSAPVHTSTPAPAPDSAGPVHAPAPVRTPASVHAPALPPRPLEMRTLDRVEYVTMPEDLKKKAINLAHQHRTLVPKKPKSKDMTYEEKQKLSLNLQELPSDKLDNVVQIIKKRNPLLSQQDDEIEVDIDSFDPETLWELDRFVTNYKKSLSKNKGNDEVAHHVTAEADHNIQVRKMEPLIAEAPEKTVAVVERIASTSLPVLEEEHGDNANESSSSSGTRSDSGSSSSDSDSGSSSGYHLPADN